MQYEKFVFPEMIFSEFEGDDIILLSWCDCQW